MTQTGWVRYFRIATVASLLPMVEYLLFRTIWSFSIAFALIAYPVVTLRCKSCGLHAFDHRIATHLKGVETLKDCPHCHEPMVEQT